MQAIKDLEEGIAMLKHMLENRTEDAEHRLPAALLEMAGMSKLAPRHVRENSGTLYGDYTPAAFKGGLQGFRAERRSIMYCRLEF